MQNKLITNDLFDTRCWINLIDGLRYFIKGIVKEAVEEELTDKMCNVNLEDKRLNTVELCERWNISKATLKHWEDDGRITPLPLGGRKKLYSMGDILNAEASGLINCA